MAWIIHKENVKEILQERLKAGSYRNGDHPFLEARFVIPLISVFPHGDECLAEFDEGGNIICAFVMTRDSLYAATAYVNDVTQMSLSYIDRSVSAKRLEIIVQSLFKKLPSFFLAMHIELQDPDITNANIFKAMNCAEVNECAENTSIPAGVEFPQYWEQRSKSVRKDIGRRIRSLEREDIAVEYRVIDGLSDADEGFSEYCRLESAGWKGKQGTALTEANNQGQFYKEVISGFMKEGQAKFHQLLFDGVVVASLIAIENNEMIIAIKTAYDESMSKFSPGRLLDYYMLQNLLVEGNDKDIENYTNASEQDQKWFSRVRQMYTVTIYRYGWVMRLASLKQKLQRKLQDR